MYVKSLIYNILLQRIYSINIDNKQLFVLLLMYKLWLKMTFISIQINGQQSSVLLLK